MVYPLVVEGEQEGTGINMKLISLNAWGGRGGKENLLAFLKKHEDVDIFCFQEMWKGGEEMAGRIAGGMPLVGIVHSLFGDVENTLKGHSSYFRPHFKDYYGLAMFVKNTLSIREEGEIFVYKNKGYISEEEVGNHARNLQYGTIETRTGLRTVMNLHGLWNGRGKTDSEDRLLQSENILNFIKKLGNPNVICGDFNLRPDTMSIKKFEAAGMRNLIKEFGITSTHSSFYKKAERFADYMLVSDGVTVNDFKVLPDEVSDHLAMYLDFE